MLTFFNEHHAQHAPPFETVRGERVRASERPERMDAVAGEFTRRGLGRIVTPHGVPLTSLERIHTPRYLHFLRSAWSEWLALDPANADREPLPAVWPVQGMRRDVEPDGFIGRSACTPSTATRR